MNTTSAMCTVSPVIFRLDSPVVLSNTDVYFFFKLGVCYLGSIVAENGGTSREVSARIQKARESFSKLRRVWLSKSLRKDTKIRIFNACVKSVLLYGCETWFVTKEIQRKIQTFVKRCLRCILRIWWPNIISNKDLWKVTGQADIIVEIRKRKFRWIGHTLRKEDGEMPKAALL